MIEAKEIQKLSDRIAQTFRPERIILFGSYAYGPPAHPCSISGIPKPDARSSC